MSNPASPTFATLVQEFFTDCMVQQRALSRCTVASYRDTFVLLLRFADKQLGKAPVSVQLPDINPKFLAAFLDHLEAERHNSPQHSTGRSTFVPEVRRAKRPHQPACHRAGACGADEAL